MLVNPVDTVVQLAPSFDEINTPPKVAAKSTAPFATRARTTLLVRPELAESQLTPLFFERKTPPPVPAKRDVPITARVLTLRFVRPAFTGIQLEPSSVDRNTPFVPSTCPERKTVGYSAPGAGSWRNVRVGSRGGRQPR